MPLLLKSKYLESVCLFVTVQIQMQCETQES